MKKYICANDLYNEIYLELERIDNFEADIASTKRRIEYLRAVCDYLSFESITPLVPREFLTNDVLLQQFAMPLIIRQEIESKIWNIHISNKSSDHNKKKTIS